MKEKVRKAGVLHRGSASGRTVRSIAPVIGAGAFYFPGPQWTIVKQIAMPARVVRHYTARMAVL